MFSEISIYYLLNSQKKKISQKNSSRVKNMRHKSHILSFARPNSSLFIFNSRLLHELNRVSKSVREIFIFHSLLFHDFLFIHPQGSVSVLEKTLLEFSEAPIHYCFEKIAAPKIFGNFPVKHPSPLQVHLQAFMWDFQSAV